jgi:hypothetical protein
MSGHQIAIAVNNLKNREEKIGADSTNLEIVSNPQFPDDVGTICMYIV